jgi:DNA-binding LacI/PurR family transcriptional regulator
MATDHLIGLGRTRIAAITGLSDTHVSEARFRGYLDAMTLAGLTPYAVEAGDFTEASGAAAMTKLLGGHPRLDAVFAANDNMAAGALRVLREAGRRVPDEIAVVGFDDLAIAAHTDPPLTTIHQPIQGLGREMTRLLLALLAGQQPSSLILPTKLVVRESA